MSVKAQYTFSEQETKNLLSQYSFALLFCWLQNVCVGIPGGRAPHYTKCQSSGVLQRRSSSPVGDVTVPRPTTSNTTAPIKSPWMNISCQSGTRHPAKQSSPAMRQIYSLQFRTAHSSRTELPDNTASLAAVTRTECCTDEKRNKHKRTT